MPSTPMSLPVRGTVRHAPDGPLLVLSQRLDGLDTFLTASLDLGQEPIPVRILTLDDLTVLRLTDGPVDHGVGTEWTGTLHLPHGLRPRTIPPDLRQAAMCAGRSLDTLDEAELRYVLTFLSESTTTEIRNARVEAVVSALPTNPRSTQ